jgi:hypothetical protein
VRQHGLEELADDRERKRLLELVALPGQNPHARARHG